MKLLPLFVIVLAVLLSGCAASGPTAGEDAPLAAGGTADAPAAPAGSAEAAAAGTVGHEVAATTEGWFTLATSTLTGYGAFDSCATFELSLPQNATHASFYLRLLPAEGPVAQGVGSVRFSVMWGEDEPLQSETADAEGAEVRVDVADPPSGAWTFWAEPQGPVLNQRFEVGVVATILTEPGAEPPAPQWTPHEYLCSQGA